MLVMRAGRQTVPFAADAAGLSQALSGRIAIAMSLLHGAEPFSRTGNS